MKLHYLQFQYTGQARWAAFRELVKYFFRQRCLRKIGLYTYVSVQSIGDHWCRRAYELTVWKPCDELTICDVQLYNLAVTWQWRKTLKTQYINGNNSNSPHNRQPHGTSTHTSTNAVLSTQQIAWSVHSNNYIFEVIFPRNAKCSRKGILVLISWVMTSLGRSYQCTHMLTVDSHIL